MTTPSGTSSTGYDNADLGAVTTQRLTRRTGETKASSKTTELYVYLAAVLAVAVTAFVVSDNGHGSHDPFSALDALRYITYLSIGYMVARGLAKAGSHDGHRADNGVQLN